MATDIAFSVPGEPRGKARARASGRVVWEKGQARAVVQVHSDPKTVRAEGAILRLFRARYPAHRPWTGPVMLRFTAVFECPASWNKALKAAAASGQLYHTSKPDKDNVEKLIVDALNGWAFADDAQIQGGGVKRYGSPARLDIILEPLDQSSLPASPAVRRAEEAVALGKTQDPRRGRRSNSPKSKLPASVQRAVEKALDKERGR